MEEKTMYQLLALVFALTAIIALFAYASKETYCPDVICPDIPVQSACICPELTCPEQVSCPDVNVVGCDKVEFDSNSRYEDESLYIENEDNSEVCYINENALYFKSYLPSKPVVLGVTPDGYEIHEYNSDMIIIYDNHGNPIYDKCN